MKTTKTISANLARAMALTMTLTITTTTLAACSAGNANNKHKKHKKHKKHRVEETISETQAPTEPTSETEPQPTESEINIQQEIHDLYYDPAYKDFDVTPDGKIVINVTSYNDEQPNRSE